MSHSLATVSFVLKIWRQKDSTSAGKFEEYEVKDIAPEMSFLEMLDILNVQLVKAKKEPVAFDHDCREGICGACSMVINGNPQGPLVATTACQLSMRHFKSGETIVIEPFRAKAFPMVRDLVVDRSGLDKIISSGGYISTNAGSAPDANCLPVRKEQADLAMDAAACIGCGACVAACDNGSAMLFVSAKNAHLSYLPQGQPEQADRVVKMIKTMEKENFGSCTNLGSCAGACPKEIKLENIAKLNRSFLKSAVFNRNKINET